MSLKTHSLPYTHTLGLKTVNNRPTDFAMCCCSPSLSAGAVFGTSKGTSQLGGGCHFFRDWYYLADARYDSGVAALNFNVHLNHFDLAPASPPSFSSPLRFSRHIAGLRVCRELESYFFSHHVLILSLAAWLTGSWSGRTEPLIAGFPPPSSSLSCTHMQTKLCFIYGFGRVQSFPPPDSCLWSASADKNSKGG